MRRLRSISAGLAAGAAIAALGAGVWYWLARPGDARPASFSYEGTKLGDVAPEFRLTDQDGRARSLADFRGRVVVLTLLDPDCTDICPVYAHHFRLAHEQLGNEAAKVAFLAFNSNDAKTSIGDVAAASRKWGMDAIPSWHFLTGSADSLRDAWRSYGVMGSGPPKRDRPEEKQHSPAIFVIDQAGTRRWYVSAHFEGAAPPSELILKHVRALLAESS